MDSGLLGLVELIIGFIFFVALCVTISRVGEIRDHAKHQTRLLEQLVKNTHPPADPTKKPAPSVAYPVEKQKSSLGTAVAIMALVFVILFIVAIATK